MEAEEKGFRVKNKQIAPIQITAEQLLRETTARLESSLKPTKHRIVDANELNELRYHKRKGFEDSLRRAKTSMGTWVRYAKWEEAQRDLDRARSILERALDINHRSIQVWLNYVEMEMRNKNVNHARNIFDRAVSILPRVDMFWYKYAYMEEMLGNIQAAREIFERWMEWEPEETAWFSYIKFEKRYKEWDKVRAIFEAFIIIKPSIKNWTKYADFEESGRQTDRARSVFERAVEYFSDTADLDGFAGLFKEFAKFETRAKEFERARVIYNYALETLPKASTEDLYKAYTLFEKQFGEKAEVEMIIIEKRRSHYEKELRDNQINYDIWFDYAQLEKSHGSHDKVRDVFERAIAQIPPDTDKKFWRRYIYLWINYAIFEELDAQDLDRAEAVYRMCLKVIPHKKFTFAKIWTLLAKFLIRTKMDLAGARKVMGQAIGMCPKTRLFKNYIELELMLREFDRCRKLYEKFLEFNPASSYAWIKYAELESMLGDTARARGIFEISITQPILDLPEMVWKGYIDFELETQEDYGRTRKLYERLLKLSENVKVWISYANFEACVPENIQEDFETMDKTRAIFERAYSSLKVQELSEERLVLLEAWKEFEISRSDDPDSSDAVAAVVRKFPKRVKKRRPLVLADGSASTEHFEEYYHYVFPDDVEDAPHLKLLAMAHQWKKQQKNQ